MEPDSVETCTTKVRMAFRFFDLNKDGFVTREEMVKCADVISSLCKASDAERETTRKQWTKWCDAIFPEGQISEEDFVRRSIKIMTEIPKVIRQENNLTFGNMFDRLDSNKDGFISPEELRLYYRAFGYGEDYDIDKVFKSLDENNDGLISREEFTVAGATYWSNTPGYEYLYSPPKAGDKA